jgi:hypothetical protein
MPTPLTIDQILTPLTPDQVRASLVNILIGLSVPADKWAKGGVASSILTATANVLSMLSGQLANGLTAYFLPKATGGILQLVAQYVYGVIPPQATFASGPYNLVNAGGGVYTVAAGALTVSDPSTGNKYTNTAPFTLNSNSSLTITIACTTSGSAGNASPDAITNLVTSLLGVTGSNPSALVGLDPLTDDALRQLCLNSLGARSVRGPRTAYAYAIQTATNSVTGNPVNINRFVISTASHTGDTNVVIAGPNGTTDPDDLTGVETSIEAQARPEGVTVTVQPATVVTYAPTLTPWVQAPAGVTAGTLQSAIAAYLTASFGSPANPIGGNVAADDAHPSGFQGILATGVTALVGQAVAAIPGCLLIALQGATDLALTADDVASWAGTVNTPRITVTS